MDRLVDTREYLDLVCQLLEQGESRVPVPVAGSSMEPFLKDGDTVYLDPPGDLARGTILLFQRPNGDYILHRINRVRRDGSFTVRGDAQTWRERVYPFQARAVAVCAKRRGQVITPKDWLWRLFATVWIWIWPLRPAIMGLWAAKKGRG